MQITGWTVVVDDHTWRLSLHKLEGSFEGMWVVSAEVVFGPNDGFKVYDDLRCASLESALERGTKVIEHHMARLTSALPV